MENVTFHNFKKIKLLTEKERQAEGWRWDPCLVADITLTLSSPVGSSQTVKFPSDEDKNFHCLAWFTTDGKTDVILKIEEEEENHVLLVNTDRLRSRVEYLALFGIAAKYDFEFAEIDDE